MHSENTNWVQQQSPSLPGWLELLSEPSLPSSQGMMFLLTEIFYILN